MRKLIARTTAYEVYKTNSYNFELVILFPHAYQIYQSLLQSKLLSNLFFDEDTNIIHLVAKDVMPFSTFLKQWPEENLPEPIAAQLIRGIGQQMVVLEPHLFGFVGLDIGDILTFNK